MKYWNAAMQQRYCADLPHALLRREQKRNETLPNFVVNGNLVTDSYYAYIQNKANQIFDDLEYKGGTDRDGNPDRNGERIQHATYNSAKNAVDSELSKRLDQGGKWMEIVLPKRTYKFIERGSLRREVEVTIANNYVKELVDRLEGGEISVEVDGQERTIPARGGSARGYDMSGLQDFNAEIEDYEQAGGWRTFGFICPDKKEIMQNLQNWVAYHEDKLLDTPGAEEDEEENYQRHTNAPREDYAANKEATDFSLLKNAYRNPLINHYRNILFKMITVYKETGDISQADVQTLQNQFTKNSNPEFYSGDPAWKLARRGEFAEILSSLLKLKNLSIINAQQCKKLIKNLASGNAPLYRLVAEGFADIDLAHYGVPTYRGQNFEALGAGNRLSVILDPNRENPEIKIPEIKKGKIIFHIPTLRKKLENRRSGINSAYRTAMGANNQAEARRLQRDLEKAASDLADFENEVRTRSVGYHFNSLDLANPEKRRAKIFLQYDNEYEIPDYIDLRDRNLGGGLNPNQNMPDAVGPSNQNVVNAIRNFGPFAQNKDRIIDIIEDYINLANNRGLESSIIFNAFADNHGTPKENFNDIEEDTPNYTRVIDRLKTLAKNVYNSFVGLIIDQCLRNIGEFALPDALPNEITEKVKSKIKKIILSVSKRLLEKNLGREAKTARTRTDDSAAAELTAIKNEINNMLLKTI
jgi:hypothetical protein